MNQPTINIVRSLARDAQYVMCDNCELVRSTCDSVPWTIRNTKWMHEDGTGHKMRYYKIESVS